MEKLYEPKNRFDHQYNHVVFSPPTDRKFTIYSGKIWKTFIENVKNRNSLIIDFGCGGGTTLFSLEKEGYNNLIGIDFCKSVPDGFLKQTQFIQSDLFSTRIEDGAADAIISTMCIEHVDDKKFVSEIIRILKPGGVILITSVLKSRFSWYFYKNVHGDRVLEPTHIREYTSKEQFQNLFFNSFEILETETPPLRYPIIDPVFRGLYSIFKFDVFRSAPVQNPILSWLRNIRMIIPGYYSIELVAKLNQ